MKEFSTLENMGITRFEEVRDFSFYSEDKVDVLKIYYKRKEGSLLPRRKVFKFPRHTLTNIDDSTGQPSTQPSPTILKAVDELNVLLKDREDTSGNKDQILRRLEQLEAEVKSNVAEIRSLIERI